MFTAGGPQEYFNYNSPVTFGHNCARGASGVAAYAFYPPFIPEGFTSPGPSTIYFDKHSNPLRRPEQRLKPDLAAMDGANTTFFSSDVSQDDDTFPNFFGTSAAAPHAAAVAALTLQAAGGPGHLKPKSLRRLLQRTTFPHDLDPNFSAGIARNGRHWVTVSANADQNTISQFDPNVFTVGYFGPGSLASVTLKPITGNQTETPTKGIVFDKRTALGAGQPFVLGTLGGLTPADITSSFSVPADPPAAAGQFKELSVTIAPGAMTSGEFFRFGVDRDEADAFGSSGAVRGKGADLLGQGVLRPEGTVTGGGATFDAVLTDGTRLTGTIKNQIGRGYSVQDGFGFINAQRAVAEALERRDDDDDEHGDSDDDEHGHHDDD
jgi:hypothetical protein